MTLSQFLLQLHSVVHGETVMKQFIVKLLQCPFLIIRGYLWSIEIVGLVCQVV